MFRAFMTCVVLIIAAHLAANAGLDPSYSPQAVIDTVPFYADGIYDQTVPTPNDNLKHPIGQWPLRYHELEDYLGLLAQSSERVYVEAHGATYEGRQLHNVFVSSKENIRNLERIRQGIARLADPSADLGSAELDSLVANLPAVAWLGYSIHGDEVSGVDAATQLIYQLTAGIDSATVTLLQQVLVIIDPIQNPDGRERYLSMLETYQSNVPNYNRFAMQHQGVWPWGRGNHYLFDMNRDWILLRQQETRGRIATITKWHPQLVVDAHEMGSNDTYLFSPPRQPINYNTPKNYYKWVEVFSADQSAAFDERGWPCYVAEWSDQWYPGYSDAWPTFFGAIGILYEMAGVDGSFVKQQDNYILTYHEAVNKQFTSSLTNITTLAENREAILRDYREARKKILADGRSSRLTYLVKPDRDEINMKRFIENLTDQGIEVKRAAESFSVNSVQNAYGKKLSSQSFPAGTYIISTDQTHGALAKAVLEFDPRLKMDFLKKERRELEKFDETKMYEISAWSTPLAYNLDVYQTTASFSATTEPVTELPLGSGELYNADAQFGYLIDMVGEKTYRMLVELFKEDLIIYCSEKPFTIEGRSYQPGALLLRKRGNKSELADILAGLATEVGLDVYGVNTGRSTEGSHLGAPTFRLLQKPRVAILAGNGISTNSFGSLWYALDLELEIPHSLVNVPDLPYIGLDQYNVLIVPGSWGPLASYLGEGGRKKIEEWVKNGGTLICTGQATVWAADTAKGISQARLKRQVLDKLDEYDLGVSRERQAESPEIDTIALWYPEKVPQEEKDEDQPAKLSKEKAEELDEWQRKFFPRGVIMRADLDSEDWLAFGMKESVPVMVYTNHALMAKPPVKTVARLADKNDIRMSGLLWPEARERWANTAYATRESKGKGQIVLFATDPNMRAYFYGSRHMFVNAVLFGPGMGSDFEGPYEQEK